MPREKRPPLKRRKDRRFRLKYDGQEFWSCVDGDYNECYDQKDEYIRQKILGEQRRKEGPTVAEYGKSWLVIAKAHVRNSTYTESAILLEKLLRVCGGKRLKDVIASDIKTVYSTYFTGLSDSYIKSARQLYVSLFDAAVADGYCLSNPAKQKAAQPHKGTKNGHRAITDQEREWILTRCTDHRAFPAVMAMLYEGLRPPEAKAFDLANVDRDAGVIRLTQFAHRKDNNHYEITKKGKTAKSAREIPLFDPFLKAIGDRKEGPLVASADGKELTIRAWNTLWHSYVNKMEQSINGVQKRWYRRTREHKKILAEAEKLRKEGKKDEAKAKEAEIPPWISFTVRPYDLRHSFATMCRDAHPPVELHTVVAWMGHADANMILKIYDEVTDDRSTKEAERLNKMLFRVQNGVQNQKDEQKSVITQGD